MKLASLFRNNTALRQRSLDAAMCVTNPEGRGVTQVLSDAKQIYAFLTGEAA